MMQNPQVQNMQQQIEARKAKIIADAMEEFMNEENKERINLDKMKTMMAQSTDDRKLRQNEDLAKLRANTSLEKTVLAARLKKDSQTYKK